jgi:hypothetical protein
MLNWWKEIHQKNLQNLTDAFSAQSVYHARLENANIFHDYFRFFLQKVIFHTSDERKPALFGKMPQNGR